MVYRGHVEKGVVVLDDPIALPEGLAVNVEPSAASHQEAELDENGQTIGQKLLQTVPGTQYSIIDESAVNWQVTVQSP